MSGKAISPMIATILLIAFTVAVGGIISIWMTGYTRTTGAAVSGATESQTACVGTFPDIISVTDNAIIVINTGSENISSIVCFAGSGERIQLGIGEGTLVPGNMTSGSWTRGSNTTVVCTASCRGIGVRGECKVGQLCWS